MVLSLVTSVATGWWFGRLLDSDVATYRPILVFSGLTLAAGAGLLLFVPSGASRQMGQSNPFRNLLSVLRDRRFSLITLSWFMSGFANLWSYPVRISYLAESGRGLDLEPGAVLVIISVIPGAVRLVTTRLWGRLFDRYNFLTLRIITNLLLGVGVLVFFLTPVLPVIGLGSVLASVGLAGSMIGWSLWITRFAPEDKTQLYMSVHVFFTGVRGILGPYLGFFFVGRFSFLQMGIVSLALTVVSSLILFRLVRSGERI
jgi:predicted MFS family arabinose efflux permease